MNSPLAACIASTANSGKTMLASSRSSISCLFRPTRSSERNTTTWSTLRSPRRRSRIPAARASAAGPELALTGSPELVRFDVQDASDRVGLAVGQEPKENRLRLPLGRFHERPVLTAEQFFQSPTLFEPPVVEAVLPVDVRDAVREEEVIRFERHHPRPIAPALGLRGRQAAPQVPDGDGLLVLDADGRAGPDASSVYGSAGSAMYCCMQRLARHASTRSFATRRARSARARNSSSDSPANRSVRTRAA